MVDDFSAIMEYLNATGQTESLWTGGVVELPADTPLYKWSQSGNTVDRDVLWMPGGGTSEHALAIIFMSFFASPVSSIGGIIQNFKSLSNNAICQEFQ